MKRRSLLVLGLGLVGLCIAVIGVGLWQTWQSLKQPPAAERAAYAPQASGLPDFWPAPSFSLVNQYTAPVSRSDLAGQIWIGNFIFTTCTTVCPLLTAQFVLLQKQLTDPRLRFVSFSVDPEHDTPAALARYAQSWNAPEKRWQLLASTPAQLADLAAGMRVAVEPSTDKDNPILHTTLFFLVDATGQVRGVYDSNDSSALQRLVVDTSGLLAALPASPGSSTSAEPPSEAGSALHLLQTLGCAACHNNAQLAPSLTGLLGRSAELEGGTRVAIDRAYLRDAILEPNKHVVAGYLKLMPSYQGHLSHEQIELLIDHLLQPPPPGTPSSTPSARAVGDKAPAQSPGRGGPTAPDTAAPDTAAPDTAAPDTAAPGPAASVGAAPTTPAAALIVKDPVCAMQVRVTPQTPHAEHAGHTYHFCSSSCRERFARDPQAFLK